MLRVGLTGGIGSGKSSAARCFQELGAPVVDADAVARDLTGPRQPAVQRVSELLGEDVSDPDGAMDRARVRAIVFDDADKRVSLERLLHPLIRKAMKNQIAALDDPYCVLEIPLLIEGGEHPLVDRIAVVHAPEALRIRRVIDRSGLSERQIRAILAAQASDEERLSKADDVIDNTGSLDDLRETVTDLHANYLALGTA